MAIGVIANDEKNKLHSTGTNKYYDSTFKISLNDKNESHAIIANNIKPNSVVLDVGCAQGIIGEAISKQLNCKVYAIELDKDAIKFAEKTNSYQKIYNFDITSNNDKIYKEFFETNLTFDYILFSDVLEHLVYPDKVLCEFAKKLKPNGVILISLPNIAHYDVVNGLLNEKFNYSAMGILDNTHLRFFTKYSFAEYIKSLNDDASFLNCKFDLEVIGRTVIMPSFYDSYSNLSKIISENSQLLVLQNIFRLTKIDIDKPTTNLDKVLSEDRIDIAKRIDNQLFLCEKQANYYEEENIRLKKEVELLKNQNDILTNNNNQMMWQLNGIYDSRTWKITEPIRKVSNKIKNIKSKHLQPNSEKKNILYLVQTWLDMKKPNNTHIGGTTLHTLELIKNMRKDYNIYVLTTIDNKYALVEFKNDEQIIYNLGLDVKVYRYDSYHYNFLYMINNLIDNLKIDFVHIQHIINFPCDLQYISKKVKVILTLHDYTTICPNYFLIDENNKYCQNASSEKCLICSKGIDIKTRNNAINNLLKSAYKIIVPDSSVMTEIKKYYDYDKFIIIPNGIDPATFSQFDYCNKIPDKIKNVAFIGGLNVHKGSDLAKQIISNNDDNIMYHLFGTSSDKFFLKNYRNYKYHGEYHKNDLPKLLNDNHIDLVLMLSICPESFSYVLSETIYSKTPIIALDIGAVGNRVKNANVGMVLDYNSDYRQIASKIKEIFKKENYHMYIKNLDKAKVPETVLMIESVKEIYDSIPNIKSKNNNSSINKFLKKFKVKYKIKGLE